MTPDKAYRAAVSLLGVTLVVATFVITLFALHRVAPESSSITRKFTVAEYSRENSDEWDEISLPHDWHVEQLDLTRLWYRFEFELEINPTGLHALYVPVVSQNAVAILNDVEIGNAGAAVDPIARNWPRPLLFPIAAELLVNGNNELVIQILSDPPGRGLLPEFYLGRWTELRPFYNSRKMLKQTALGASVVILITVAMFLFFITWKRKESSEYAWGAATFLALSGHSLPIFFLHAPVPAFLWEWWQHSCIGFTILFMLLFVNRYFKLRMKLIEVWCALFVAILSIVSLFVSSSDNFQASYYYGGAMWGLISLLIGIIPLYVTMRNAVGNKDMSALYMLCVGSVMFILGTHDALFVSGILTRENGYLIHYASPLVALLLTAILISRLIETSSMLEELNRSLKDRIIESNRELAASYERVQDMERQQILATERERFGRDMHDGLGSHLSTALALSESKLGAESPLTNTIRDATDEMRLMLDTASAIDEDIGMIIGSLRAGLQSQAEIAGFNLIWNIAETSPIKSLGPGTALSLVRLIQECVNNALKHSGGDLIRVSVSVKEREILLEICDNGKCIRLNRKQGKGINNITKRTQELNALLSFNQQSPMGGLSVRVDMPFNQ